MVNLRYKGEFEAKGEYEPDSEFDDSGELKESGENKETLRKFRKNVENNAYLN